MRKEFENAFYLPGSYMHTYSNGDNIYAKVNSLTSIETELPYSYYSLPYCKPLGDIKKSAENLGELLNNYFTQHKDKLKFKEQKITVLAWLIK